MRKSLLMSLILIAGTVGCRPAAVDLAAERLAIEQADQAWVAAAKARNLEEALRYWTDDATVLAPDMPPIKGKEAIRQYVSAAFQIPGFSISWQSEEITVAEDGKLAYQLASNEVTLPDSTGAIQTVSGKAVVIWRKEADGNWRAVVDIWNGNALVGGAPQSK